MSRTSLAEAIYAWQYESISRGRADSPHSRPYQGITPLDGLSVSANPVKAPNICFSSSQFRKQQVGRENSVSKTSVAVVVCT
ncbi:unnamed protein product [Schistosoma mattheei]|uniref:Uncharacterized protein n=1 Tax=Schistosoma mattheei TaxID=31246 RepID=A0A3P8IR28_9TREM|nr:unnamed protein product [Schistosoma mattheei]